MLAEMEWLLFKTLNVIAAGWITASAYIFALTDTSAIEKLVATFGTLIALAWYMYQNTKVTIPTIHKDNREAIEKLTETHERSQHELGRLFSDSLKEERESRETQAREFQASLREMTGTCRWKDKE